MGLDAVEIMMDLEEEFGIEIDDDDVWYFDTLGSVHDYLLEKLGIRAAAGDCPTRKAFYRLRRAFAAVFEIEANELTPHSEILPRLGLRQRARNWRRIENESGLKLPDLSDGTDRGVLWGGAITGGLTLVAVTVMSRNVCIGATVALLGLVPGMLLGFVVGALTIRPTVDPRHRTLGDLSRVVAAINHQQLRPPHAPSSEVEHDEVWERLCNVIVEQLGVRREKLHRGTRLAEDLGC